MSQYGRVKMFTGLVLGLFAGAFVGVTIMIKDNKLNIKV